MNRMREIHIWYKDQVLPYKDRYVAVARRILGDADAAQDAVQEVLTKILATDGWKVIYDPRAYIMRMVYNRCIDELRSRKISPLRPITLEDTLSFADPGPSAFDIISVKETADLLFSALDMLPPQTQKVLTMRFIEGLTPQEISDQLGTSWGTVRGQLADGRKMWLEQLRRMAQEEDLTRKEQGREQG